MNFFVGYLETVWLLTSIFISAIETMESPDDKICSVPRSNLPIGIPNVIPGGSFLKFNVVFGSDFNTLKKIGKKCNVYVYYTLVDNDEKEIEDTYESLNLNGRSTITFNNLQKNTDYKINWHLSYYLRPWRANPIASSEPQIIHGHTNNATSPSKKVTVEYDEEKGSVKLVIPDSASGIAFFYYWTPLNCKDLLLWSNNSQWKEVIKTQLEYSIDVRHIFYSDVIVNVAQLEKGYYMKTETFNPFRRSTTGIPDNAILDISFSRDAWIVDVEKNCYKQNGPKLNLHYELRPIKNPKLINNVTIGTIETKQERNDKWRFKIKKLLFHNTKYEISVSFDPAMINSKKLVNTTPNSAPHPARNLTLCSSYKKFTVSWMKPKQFPPTGLLDKFVIKDPIWNTFPEVVVNASECLEWCTKEIKDISVNVHYEFTVQILAYNIDVTKASETSGKIKILTKKILEKPSSITLINRTSSSLLVAIEQSYCNSDLYEYVIFANDTRNFTAFVSETEKKNKLILANLSSLNENEKYSITVQSCDENRKFCSSWSEPKVLSTTPNFANLISIRKEEEMFCVDLKSFTLHEQWKIFTVYAAEKEGYHSFSNFECKSENYFLNNKTVEVVLLNKFNSTECHKISVEGDETIFSFWSAACLNKGIEWHTWPVGTINFKDTTNTSTIITILMSLVLVVLIVVLVYTFRYLKFRPATLKVNVRKSSMIKEPETMKKLVNSDDDDDTDGGYETTGLQQPEGEVVYMNALIDSDYNYDIINDLENCLRNPHQIEYNFKSVPKFVQNLNCSHGETEFNLRKNRYKNNLPYNETRVILPQINGDPTTDYINASYVNIPNYEQKLIATQGPKDSGTQTINDFYRMIWHCRPSHVVMIANLVEKGKKKVGKYWPSDSYPVNHGNIQVTLVFEENKKHYVTRVLQLQKGSKCIKIMHYQFTSWPDHGSPTNPFSFSQLAIRIHEEYSFEAPIIVHCSAGIGRTGTLLLVLAVMKQLEHEKKFDFKEALWSLRRGRPKLVENANQFYFGHQLVLEILNYKLRTKSAQSFSRELALNEEMVIKEFQEIEQQRFKVGNNTYQWTKQHPEVNIYNRNQDVIPDDEMMAPMIHNSFDFHNQYLNAVTISHDDLENIFIVTEHPMANTIDRFWQYVVEYGISNIILMNYFDGSDEEFPSIMPHEEEEEPMILNENLILSMTSNDDDLQGNSLVQEFQVTITAVDQSMEPHRCQVLQLLNWDQFCESPSSNEGILFIAEKLRPYGGYPTIITCRDGVTASCWMATLLTGLNLLDNTSQINIHSVALNTIVSRPQAIISQVQYDYLYLTISNYIDQILLTTN